ncbi:hypothetical protein HYC85_023418 [Camellia sinensis]|uniref:Uncharacterized protein n=1 Tax=Camellia sinensis TaxID=4442 RepID=A0A7J7GEJ3_CAMSI|nr:hypothetical protein HYC85_023418 [Camellia sinensis]
MVIVAVTSFLSETTFILAIELAAILQRDLRSKIWRLGSGESFDLERERESPQR